ncbi:MAG: NUDIX hydrolase [Pseudonocardia sp.]|nr:NUDIX hydrolase [Pseudonocardia sp.]
MFLTVDVVLFTPSGCGWRVLLIRRGHQPFVGCWALPGGYVDEGERIEHAARRELAEETGLVAPRSWRRVGIYDKPDRDPRGRVVSVAYAAVLAAATRPVAGDDARDAGWIPLEDVVSGRVGLAFDHDAIVRDAAEPLTASNNIEEGQR